MKVLVELNHLVNSFNIKEEHKERLVNEFPEHEFIFCDSYAELKEKIAMADLALVWVFSEHLYSKASRLQALYTPAAGHDWVAEDPNGQVKCHHGTYHGEMICESFLSMMLMINNCVIEAYRNFLKADWKRNAFGRRSLLRNQNLLILGCGNIGRICAEKVAMLGMEVTGVRRKKVQEDFQMTTFDDLHKIIGEYDHVLNLLPGGPETEKMVDEKMIRQMKSGAAFYNFGRGTTVDEDALIKAMNDEHLVFAGLDVASEEPLPPESPLWTTKNVFITPHSSCCYEDYLELFIDELKEKL